MHGAQGPDAGAPHDLLGTIQNLPIHLHEIPVGSVPSHQGQDRLELPLAQMA